MTEDHTCQSMFDADGNLTAVVRGDPNMSPEAREALTELVAAAHRMHDAMPAEERAELEARQATDVERIRAGQTGIPEDHSRHARRWCDRTAGAVLD